MAFEKRLPSIKEGGTSSGEREKLPLWPGPGPGPGNPAVFTLASLLLRLVLRVIPGSLHLLTLFLQRILQGQRAHGRQDYPDSPLPGVQPHGGWDQARTRAVLTDSF